MQRWTPKNFFSNLLLAVTSVVATIFLAELAFRAALFSEMPYMKRYRLPELYAYVETDDYWKLYFLFGGKLKAPKTPHPLLGWVSEFIDGATYTHAQYARVTNKRPVLLYGDSFARCAVDEKECFQGILNDDPDFSKRLFLLNYGVGGYGVDQIFLLYQKSIGHYKNPFVILSMFTEDLDRSVLSVRVGQKPFYRLIDNSLVLSGIPIPSPELFFPTHPPGIRSYLFRMLIHNDSFRRFIHSEGPPSRIKNHFRTEPLRMREHIEQINRHIILEIIRDFRKRGLDFLFLIFHPQWALVSSDDWRDEFLTRLLDSNNVPYLSSKLILKEHADQHHARYEDYYLAGDGHPNGYQNRIIADQLKTYLAGSSNKRRHADLRRHSCSGG